MTYHLGLFNGTREEPNELAQRGFETLGEAKARLAKAVDEMKSTLTLAGISVTTSVVTEPAFTDAVVVAWIDPETQREEFIMFVIQPN